MSKLTDFKLLSFDVYGTLIDWEGGLIRALAPMLESGRTQLSRQEILETYKPIEVAQQKKTPDMKYSELLATILPEIRSKLGLSTPSAEECKKFGQSIGTWPAFPDTVEALKRLSKHYKLVVLTNCDNESFKASNDGPMEGFKFDGVFTAEMIGSYKPDHRNFEYMFQQVKERFGIDRSQVLQTANSQFHDHHPAKEIGLKSCWIYRPGHILGQKHEHFYNWKFDTLADMADAVDEE